MNIHALKTLPEYFAPLRAGEKTFELRKNDRDFKVGDQVCLQEWSPQTGYTGKQFWRRISYVLKDAPEFGLMDGFVILGLGRI